MEIGFLLMLLLISRCQDRNLCSLRYLNQPFVSLLCTSNGSCSESTLSPLPRLFRTRLFVLPFLFQTSFAFHLGVLLLNST